MTDGIYEIQNYVFPCLGTSKGKKQGQSNQASESKKSGKASKKGTQQQSSGKEKFTHSWLVSTLKGHSGNILGIDLSPNNKFLASCADGL